jgi:DNA modification methylase
MGFLEPESIHLVVTSPPYWTLKEYNLGEGQMGYIRATGISPQPDRV